MNEFEDAESDFNALKDWWVDNAAAAADATIPKAIAYSSQDLADIGYTMAGMLGLKATSIEEATEIGLLFYLQGKLSRWIGAVKEGRRPSDDTLFDGMVYFTMAIRNRAVGGWPFAPDEGN
jgi:hypothetical protein